MIRDGSAESKIKKDCFVNVIVYECGTGKLRTVAAVGARGKFDALARYALDFN